MANDSVLGTLGLALRAGKLACGDEAVRALCAAHKARCVFLTEDAGASTAKRAAAYAEQADIPLVTLPQGRDVLGAAIGRDGCAVCAVSDIGMAASIAAKLAALDERYQESARLLAEKARRIRSRKGKNKNPPGSHSGT